MAENKQEGIQSLEESDIFEGFTSDSDLLQDVDTFEQEQSKDLYDYINISGNIIKTTNVIFFIILLILGLYVYVQKNPDLKNSKLIDPFCDILLGEIRLPDTYCSSVAVAKDSLSETLSLEKNKQFNAIVETIQPLYLSTDFINSNEVIFLYDISKSRLRPLSVLEEFDRLKNNFEKVDKSALECSDIEIQGGMMSARCDAYSSDWDKSIILPDGESSGNIGGTSISIASSFLDFIETNSSSLRVVDKPKTFSAENVSGENGGYTKKTTFFLELEYSNNILSL